MDHFNPPPANGLASKSTQHPLPVCTWSTAPQRGPSRFPFPRSSHTLTTTATANGELFLFGGYKGHVRASSDLYVFSTWDFSATLLQTSGEAPTPRAGHGTALVGSTLLICGGKTYFGHQDLLDHDSVYLLNLVSLEWTRVGVNGPGPGRRYRPTTTVVGSKLFVFGGQIDGKSLNDMWALDLNSLKSQPHWESYEPTPGNEKPLPRARHVSVATEDRIIIFGGTAYSNKLHDYNDTWSFDIFTQKWTELQCTGSIPSHRNGHAAVLVDDVMYVFGGCTGATAFNDLYALHLSKQRWFKFDIVGPSPHKRMDHAMAFDGTRVFVLGGYSEGARMDEISLIDFFDTKDIKYPELSLQITHERNRGPNGQPLEFTGVNSKPRRVPEGDVGGGSTEYLGNFAAPRSSEREVTRSELERQLSISLAAKTEWDQRIARLTALLGQAGANATEAAKRAGLELREHAGRLLMQTPLVEQRDAELLNMQAKLGEFLLACDQQIGQYEKKDANMRAKFEAMESELEAVRLRLADTEKGFKLIKSKAEADTLHAQTATSSVNREEDQVTRRRAGPELREHTEAQRLIQASLVKQRDVESVDMQARLTDMQAKLDELLLSRDQRIGQYEKELANVRTKLEAKESELEAIRLRLTDAETELTKSKAEADTLRAQTATGSVNRDEDQVIMTRRLMERVRAIEAEITSRRWNEKSIEERNEE